ncbi:hypothetical protein OF365_03170, partial [Ureaplasma zalophigenitalium]|nr:hypothetical protein [Ureaplasma zalophigenitalium]
IKIWLPETTDEIKNLSNLLKRWSVAISLLQCKLEKLKNLKNTLLEKMFADEKHPFPKIRFKEFTNAWERKELGDSLIKSNKKNTSYEFSFDSVLSVSRKYGIINQISLLGRSYASKKTLSNYKVIELFDLVYTRSPLNSFPFGIIDINQNKKGILSTLYLVFKPKNTSYSLFLKWYFLQRERTNNYLIKLINKGAKNTILVSEDEFLKGVITMTPNITEIKYIYNLFAFIESAVSLLQRKLEKMENIKNTLLQKMFV